MEECEVSGGQTERSCPRQTPSEYLVLSTWMDHAELRFLFYCYSRNIRVLGQSLCPHSNWTTPLDFTVGCTEMITCLSPWFFLELGIYSSGHAICSGLSGIAFPFSKAFFFALISGKEIRNLRGHFCIYLFICISLFLLSVLQQKWPWENTYIFLCIESTLYFLTVETKIICVGEWNRTKDESQHISNEWKCVTTTPFVK